jgi:hypothetical protein
MKIALMILFVWGGMAVTSASAQLCTPCPPAACKAICTPAKNSSSVSSDAAVQNALVTFSPNAMANPGQAKNVSGKDAPGCQPICQPGCTPAAAKGCTPAPAPAKGTAVASTTPRACQPAPISAKLVKM